MGACASKPKVKGGKEPATEPAPAPATEKKDVDVVVVEFDKKVEVPAEEVVDDQSVKRRSLSHLFKEVFHNPLLLSPISFSFLPISIANYSLSFYW